MTLLNLGIVAHVDAGKTSLTERLLYDAGVLTDIGSVDDGTTRTDSLDLERARGITIRAAVVSFRIGDVTVNLLDTPGHPDFIAEVERVLGVLDAAVLVVSAVEGVQAQTRVLMRALCRLRIPTVVFVNKIDRAGARRDEIQAALTHRLGLTVVAMGATTGLGTPAASFTPYPTGNPQFREQLIDVLSDGDDSLLADYVRAEHRITDRRLRDSFVKQVRCAQVHPVYFGSAVTGAGVAALSRALTQLGPAEPPEPDAPMSATVFKIDRGATGDKVCHVRMFTGTLTVRDRVRVGAATDTVTAVRVFEQGETVPRRSVRAGEIAQVSGLVHARIGDVIGSSAAIEPKNTRHFAPPTLETVVSPVRAADRGRTHAALTQLAEQDPLIGLRQDDRGELSLSLYGEVQKEVIQATLAADFDVEVGFGDSVTLCIERPRGVGSAVEVLHAAGNPFLATVGLRVEPAEVGTGVRYRLAVELGSMPFSLMRAVEETVHATLAQGLHGWPVTDCVVTMTHSGYAPRQSHAHAVFDKSMSSTAGDFRLLTPLVLLAALAEAGTQVCEPVHRFTLELPASCYGAVLPVLARLRAVPQPPVVRGDRYSLGGTIPAARVHDLRQRLPGLTAGEGVLEDVFDHYEPVTGEPPTRARTDADPLHREEYLLRVQRRV